MNIISAYNRLTLKNSIIYYFKFTAWLNLNNNSIYSQYEIICHSHRYTNIQVSTLVLRIVVALLIDLLFESISRCPHHAYLWRDKCCPLFWHHSYAIILFFSRPHPLSQVGVVETSANVCHHMVKAKLKNVFTLRGYVDFFILFDHAPDLWWIWL